jgi:hypothetical protein
MMVEQLQKNVNRDLHTNIVVYSSLFVETYSRAKNIYWNMRIEFVARKKWLKIKYV